MCSRHSKAKKVNNNLTRRAGRAWADRELKTNGGATRVRL